MPEMISDISALRSLEVEVAAAPAAFRAAWEVLEAEGCCLPFQSYAWAEEWCQHVAPAVRASPCVVCISQSGHPLTILPLCVVRRGIIRSLEFMDGGVGDYNAPVLARGDRVDVLVRMLPALFERVRRALPAIDCVRLRNMPGDIDGMSNPMLLLPKCRPQRTSGHTVYLDRFPDEARSVIREVAKKRRRLERAHQVKLAVDGGDGATFDALIEGKCRRYPHSSLCDDRIVAFYRALMERGGLVRMYRLLIDGATVATQYAVVSRQTCTGLIIGFDPAWHEVSPGKLLMVAMLQHLRADGFSTFDAGLGDEAYKAEFGGAWRHLHVVDRAVTPVGAAYLSAFEIARRGQDALRRAISSR
jgi:CelD/BcsL family acetyltransferase involved in cellulose biosynthesis